MSSAFLLVAICALALLGAEGCHDMEGVNVLDCTVTVRSLGDLFNSSFAADSVVCVNLSADSTETLDYRDTVLTFSVVIWGNNSIVSCVTDSSMTELDNYTVYTHFPLRVHNASLVQIMDIQFDGCKRPLQFEWVQSIAISSSQFSNFEIGGAMEIHNSPHICIQDSSFTNDTSQGIGNQQFSGNAGGVAIGYSDVGELYNDTPVITVSRCSFMECKALADDDDFLFTVLDVLRDRIYNQRGGGMAFYFGEDYYTGRVNIEDCEFINNRAQDSGGGIYMFLSGKGNSHTVNISNTNFTGNNAQDGGGLEITHSNPNSTNYPNVIRVVNCTFSKNWGKFGGGYKNIQLDDLTNLNHLFLWDSVFDSNVAEVGAAIYLQSVVTVKKVTLLNRIEMESCNFINNTGIRGVVFVIGNVVTFKGDTTFENSTGSALRILGTLVNLQGEIMFRENRDHPEGFSGALYLSSFGQIVLHAGTNITFLNNTGREGACIVVKGQLIASAFTKQLYNPQCFLQYENQTEPPHRWNVHMTFRGNEAQVGPVVFLSDGTVCLWNNDTSPFFEKDLQSTWERFMDMSDNLVNGVDNSSYYIQTGIANLTLDTYPERAYYPGERVRVEPIAIDQFGQNTSAFIGISSPDNPNITFEPSIVPIDSSYGVVEFEFISNNTDDILVELNPFFSPDLNSRRFYLSVETCLPGHSRNADGKCVCSMSDEVILCSEDYLLLAHGLWGAPPSWSRTLVTYSCPPNYCRCRGLEDSELEEGCPLDFNNPEMICHEDRRRNESNESNETNVLCGRCKEKYGVGLLTNNCKKHERVDVYWLVPIYAIALVVSLVLLVKLGVHLPTILRGFVFYIQISPIAVAYFPDAFTELNEVVSCVGSTLALYVPYDFTFYPEMPSLVSYALRYSAPLVALVVAPIAARVRRHRSKYWHGIWTIVLLMYIMAVETSVSLLFCPTLSSKDNRATVWFFDGNVKCFTNWHIPLAILAIVSLLALALLILFVAASIYYKTLRKKYERFERLERVHHVITRGIKKEYKWWPIMELSCRFIFVTTVILTPGYVVVPLALTITIFVMQTFVHPYRSTVANYMESLLFLWLACLLGLSNTTAVQESFRDDEKELKWIDVLLIIPVAVGLIVLVVHSTLLFVRKVILPYKKKTKKSNESVLRHLTVSYSVRKHRAVNLSGKVTNTVIGLDDEHSTNLILNDIDS